MNRRRSALCVPASDPGKIAKALALAVDEVIIDLEDAVAPEHKISARANLSGIKPREHGIITVRINAAGTSWFDDDINAVVRTPAVDSIVVPKAEQPQFFTDLDSQLTQLEQAAGRTRQLTVQALIESAEGLAQVQPIARSSQRLEALIIGYADLGASLGRSGTASWLVVQEAVLLAARVAGLQAIDGPQLTIEDGTALREATTQVRDLGFDGKWVIHPRQFNTVQDILTPDADAVLEAQELLAAMDDGIAQGLGAIKWRGRMLDEAVAVQARRLLSKAVAK